MVKKFINFNVYKLVLHAKITITSNNKGINFMLLPEIYYPNVIFLQIIILILTIMSAYQLIFIFNFIGIAISL